MNYTGRPSISGCRPVLSLYPTHRFCQYLLLIFITFTNSFLFNRAFSTNSRRPLRRAAGVTLPGCALSGASRQLPQRGSLWQAGSLSTGRLRLDRTQKGGPCLRGQRLLDNAPCQAVAGLDSGALPFPDRVSFARPDESWPTCQWLPLWGSWRAQARLRGQGCCQTALTQR